MKNIFRATRPAWAIDIKTPLILLLSVLIGVFCLRNVDDAIVAYIKNRGSSTAVAEVLFTFVSALLITGICLAFLEWYRRSRLKFYPGTFIYCFKKPTDSKSEAWVVGFFYVQYRPNGEFIAQGSSFDWDVEHRTIVDNSQTGFDSIHVGCSERDEETTCHILYRLKQSDLAKRPYTHGLLQFTLVDRAGLKPVVGTDIYVGHVQSTNEGAVYVHARGYGERLEGASKKLDEGLIKLRLRENGETLFARTRTLVQNASPLDD